jgi:hypothetical protein
VDPDTGRSRLRVFISYRRADASAYAGRLADSLVARFGGDSVFMDIDTIPVGADFRDVIDEALSECDVVLALIGREWLQLLGSNRRRRIENTNDYVRLELEAALQRPDVLVVPVLVQGVDMPPERELPPSLAPITFRNNFELSDRRWRSDVERLCDALEAHREPGMASEPSSSPAAAPPAGADEKRELLVDESPKSGDASPGRSMRDSHRPESERSSRRIHAPSKRTIAVIASAVVVLIVAAVAFVDGRSHGRSQPSTTPITVAACFASWFPTASPTTGLRDRDQVLISVSGLSCNPKVNVYQCASTTPTDIGRLFDGTHCSNQQGFDVLSRGSATMDFTMQSMHVGGGDYDCTRAPTVCWLYYLAGDPNQNGSSKAIPMSFGAGRQTGSGATPTTPPTTTTTIASTTPTPVIATPPTTSPFEQRSPGFSVP